MTDQLLAAIQDAWRWSGAEPRAIVSISPFGHVITAESDGSFRYLDPELRTFERVADDRDGLELWAADPDNREVWAAERLVDEARRRLGEPPAGSCYSLTPHALLTGDYDPRNLWIIAIEELVRFAGDVARQTRDLPDGSRVRLKVVA